MSDKLIIKQTALSLVESISKDNSVIPQLEMSLKMSDTISKPLVRSVFKGNGATAFTFVTILVKRFTDSFGFSTKMTPIQIEMLVVDTLEHFNYESIEDIILFFKMARSGRFGATKRGVDSNLIFGEWFPMYMEIKSNEREKQVQKVKIDTSLDKRGTTMEEVLKDKIKLQKRKKIQDVENYVDRICLNFDRQMLEDTILDWSKDKERNEFIDILKRKRKTISYKAK